MRVLFGCLVFLGACLARADEPKSGDAPAFYEAACESAVDGDARRRLLERAIEVDPDYAPARAELGHVLIDGRWRPAGYAAKMAAYDPRQAEYQERLAQARDTLKDHRRLAKWSEAEGLGPETRMHWLSVLKIDPNQKEALNGLNAEWRDGELWDRELAAEAEERAEATAFSAEQWEKRFSRYEKRPTEDRLDQIRAELAGAAVAPIERRAMRMQASEATRGLVVAFLEESHAFEEPEVTASLCRIAIFAADQRVRDSVVVALTSRPRFDVMPLLLSSLLAPIASESRIVRNLSGDVLYEHRVAQVGEESSREHLRRRGHDVSVRVLPRLILVRATRERTGVGSYTSDQNRLDAILRARLQGAVKQLEYQREAEATDAWAEAYNRFAGDHNARVYAALTAVSGRDLGVEPTVWWDAWQRETGYQRYDRPTQRTYDVSFTRSSATADQTAYETPRCSCFVAGTPVWTRTGQKPIETLKPGELVLSRDPQRGGLVYRAVTGTTVRKPSPTYTIAARGEQIVCTEGHPFWVIGQGWRMAKELRDGDVLSTIAGPTPIESIGEAKPAQAYNLIVEGAANYYVGDTGVLVHDNTPRLPAVGLIAGR